ncbi:HD domain-containing protein [Paenibacillus ginsengarvi]|uniref:HD domain-containing protein n=1 Tax=Paenibacillus ginsengarvi TaxID=400777 RepID=A0A3B0CJV2_9BACL|nr:HD domain-containing protein [Paenibacillus ginsengarvi]RKN85683.1 HD domain-containing protein [Paenibacillus ginsengarvi]
MIVQDPLHGSIRIDDVDIRELAHTAAFRRLAGLKQQGHTCLLLPEATHSRYSHSLGVYANMRSMIEKLQAAGSTRFEPFEIKIGLTAALLHDIGHGPLSHCFEAITGIHHERWTTRMIAEHPELADVLARTPGLTEGVLSVIGRYGDYPVLQELLFSQIGADRLDYTARDWYFSGIGAEPLEPEAFIRAMWLRAGRLVLLPEAVPYVEQFVRVKRKLFEQGFQHPDVIGKDVLLKLLFKRARLLFVSGQLQDVPEPLLPLFDGSFWPVAAYAELDDESIGAAAARWAGHEDALLSLIGRTYLAPLKSSIAWKELDGADDPRAIAVLPEAGAPFLSEIAEQQIKYGCYRAGIGIAAESGRIFDVSELSETIREHSRYSGKRYLFYIR